MGFIDGKKSYLIAVATLGYVAFGMLSGHMSLDEGIKLALASGALATLRHGIEKVGK